MRAPRCTPVMITNAVIGTPDATPATCVTKMRQCQFLMSVDIQSELVERPVGLKNRKPTPFEIVRPVRGGASDAKQSAPPALDMGGRRRHM